MMRALPIAVAGVLAPAISAQVVPDGWAVETMAANGLDHPTDFCFLPDGRVLVVSRSGQVAVLLASSTTAVPIGMVPWVENLWQFPTAMPSIAVDPAFSTNGHVYVLYASATDVQLHLDRFTCTGAIANPASANLQLQTTTRHVLLNSIPDILTGTNGGSVRFGPDGMLYVAIDDDSSPCSAQQTLSQGGCLLRLDVGQRPPGGSLVAPAYAALDPGNNPFSAANDFSQLVLGIGLRAPSRLEIDFATGNLYLGDIGNTLAHEVSEYVPPAAGALPFANFGWPWFEGALPSAGCAGAPPSVLHAPILSIPMGSWQRVCSGPRYRNQQGWLDYGPLYEGDLFVADRTAGEIRRYEATVGWSLAAPEPGQPTPTAWANGFQGVTSMRQGPDGALWILQQQVLQSGVLRRLRPPGTTSTVVAISGDGQRVPMGEPFPQPLVVRVFDPQMNVVPSAPVTFTVLGGATLSTTNPVLADAQGVATTTAVSTFGGAVTVSATTPGSVPTQLFRLHGRRLATSVAGNLLIVQIDNATDAVPAFVPYVVMLAFPGSPTVPSPVGPLCVDPTWALSVVFEDGIGAFGGITMSGLGALGTPSLYRQYTLPPGLLTGQLIRFQAVGFDPVTGWFATNCATRQF